MPSLDAYPWPYHAFITIAALKADCMFFCEKPMAHNILGTRMVRKLVQKRTRHSDAVTWGQVRTAAFISRNIVAGWCYSGNVTRNPMRGFLQSRCDPGIYSLPQNTNPLSLLILIGGMRWDRHHFGPYTIFFSPVHLAAILDIWLRCIGRLWMSWYGCTFLAFDLSSPSEVQIYPCRTTVIVKLLLMERPAHLSFPERKGQGLHSNFTLVFRRLKTGLESLCQPDLQNSEGRSAMYVGERGYYHDGEGDRFPSDIPNPWDDLIFNHPVVERILRSKGSSSRLGESAHQKRGQPVPIIDYGSRVTRI